VIGAWHLKPFEVTQCRVWLLVADMVLGHHDEGTLMSNDNQQQPAPTYQPQQHAYGQPYGPPVVVAAYQPGPPRGLSITSMILGLVSIVAGFTLVVPLVGLILGFVGIRKEPAGRGMAITGLILNGIIIAGWVILFLIMLLAGIGIFGAAATSGSTTGY